MARPGGDTRAFSLGVPRVPRRRLGASRPDPKAKPRVKPLEGLPYLYRGELMLYRHSPTKAAKRTHIWSFSIALRRLTSSRHRFLHLISCHAIRSTEPLSVFISRDHVRECSIRPLHVRSERGRSCEISFCCCEVGESLEELGDSFRGLGVWRWTCLDGCGTRRGARDRSRDMSLGR